MMTNFLVNHSKRNILISILKKFTKHIYFLKHQIIKFKEINLTVRQHLFEILLKDVIAIAFTHSIVPFIAQL